VEAVIGEPCSTILPENREFTGNFLFFSALFNPKPTENPSVTRSPRVCLIRCNETEQGITGKSREFAINTLRMRFLRPTTGWTPKIQKRLPRLANAAE
jgi:hypothetical protein